MGCTYTRGLDWRMDLELQAITALSLIYTLTTTHAKTQSCIVSPSRCLVTAPIIEIAVAQKRSLFTESPLGNGPIRQNKMSM
jgi:hypothetical protein